VNPTPKRQPKRVKAVGSSAVLGRIRVLSLWQKMTNNEKSRQEQDWPHSRYNQEMQSLPPIINMVSV
jgi:hypothetical protein